MEVHGEWKRGAMVKGRLLFFPERPDQDHRVRDRSERNRFRGTRLFCPECVDQGSFEPRFARPELWCESFCWKHAREKGLKPPPSRAGKNKKPQKKCKKSAQQANAKKDPDFIEEEDEGTEFEEKAEKDTKGKKATSIKKEKDRRKKKLRPAAEIQEKQEPVEKRKKIWRSNPHPHPATELAEDFENCAFPEDAEDSEAQLSEENASEQDLPTP